MHFITEKAVSDSLLDIHGSVAIQRLCYIGLCLHQHSRETLQNMDVFIIDDSV